MYVYKHKSVRVISRSLQKNVLFASWDAPPASDCISHLYRISDSEVVEYLDHHSICSDNLSKKSKNISSQMVVNDGD